MAGNAGIDDPRPKTHLGENVAVADPAGLYADSYLAGTGIREFALYNFKWGVGGRDLNGSALY
jgi:hypothetical protein